jgi:hypothetical protein
MKETFLHYVWQHQYFDKSNLRTTAGEAINIISTGNTNTNAGPDFQNAKVKIETIDWHGHVEIHVKSSEWEKHGHTTDAAYHNVILHVVWEDDSPITYPTGKKIATLELKGRVAETLLLKSELLLDNPETIACTAMLPNVSTMTKLSMVERAMVDRLEQKAAAISEMLHANSNDWEETAYQWLAKNMGFKINSEAFLALARVLPCKILKKYRDNELQLEALVFGMAGMLNRDYDDTYYHSLSSEFQFLAQKHQLQGRIMNESQWKFLRLRPANFPTIRLAQFVQIIKQQDHLFDFITNFEDQKQIVKKLKLDQSSYWQQHYRFGVPASKKIAGMGQSSIENIIINTSAPLLAAYSQLHQSQDHLDKALHLLTQVKAEKNHIIEAWTNAGEKMTTGFDSQGYLSLYQTYCKPRKCLQCGIGFSIMGRTK